MSKRFGELEDEVHSLRVRVNEFQHPLEIGDFKSYVNKAVKRSLYTIAWHDTEATEKVVDKLIDE